MGGNNIVIMQLMSFSSSEIGSKISSFFGGSNEDENKESKVEVSDC